MVSASPRVRHQRAIPSDQCASVHPPFALRTLAASLYAHENPLICSRESTARRYNPTRSIRRLVYAHSQANPRAQVRAALHADVRTAHRLQLRQRRCHADSERRRRFSPPPPRRCALRRPRSWRSHRPPTRPRHRRSPPCRPPSPVATISFVSSTPPSGGGASACDNATFVSDVTIPDGTTMKPGEKFTKTWRMYNSGTCNWTTGYKWVFVSGDAMGGATTVLPAQVNSGSQTDISVALTAPTTNGTFKGYWRMQNATGVVVRQSALGRDQGWRRKHSDARPKPHRRPEPNGLRLSIHSFRQHAGRQRNNRHLRGQETEQARRRRRPWTTMATIRASFRFTGRARSSRSRAHGTSRRLFEPIDDVTADMSGLDFTATH